MKHAILPRALAVVSVGLAGALFTAACGGGASSAGEPCSTAKDCYPNVDPSALKGTVTCLDKVQGGYCTHSCKSDSDCCAVANECPSGHPQVCAPFESGDATDCFVSCESADIGSMDPNAYCQTYANASFTCRSTGGGSANRKICAN